MDVKGLLTRDTNIVHLLGKEQDDKIVLRQTGIHLDVYENYSSWYQHDGIWYFYKTFHSFFYEIPESMKLINELIGELLAHKLEVPSVHYQIAERNNIIGLISENFIKKGQDYYFMKDLRLPTCFNGDKNLIILRKYCKDDDNYRQLLSEILKLVAIDLYMSQEDRNPTNIQFTRKDGELHLTPLYDFEASFGSSYQYEYCSALLGITPEEIDKYPALRDYLTILFHDRIEKVLEQIEDEKKILIPSEIKKKYSLFEEDRRMILTK